MTNPFLRCACNGPSQLDGIRRCVACGQFATVDRIWVERMVGRQLDWKCCSWINCNHANECPARCPCDVTCICRIEGSCVSQTLDELERWSDIRYSMNDRLTLLRADATRWSASKEPGLSIDAGKWEEVDFTTMASLRPGWDEIWIEMAHLLSRRSIDPRTKVGCLIVSDDNTQVLAVGYNGNYRGGPNAVESLEPGKSGTIHAETNALIKCDYNNPKRKVMYVTTSPCVPCAKLIINGGIDEVVYDVEYRDISGLELLRSASVKVRRYVRDKP